MMTREQIVDRISELLIQSYSVLFETQDLQITDFQKVVTNGFITAGRTDMNDRLVVYKEDLHANKEDEDLINYIYNQQFIADNIFGIPQVEGELNPQGGLSPQQFHLDIQDGASIVLLVINGISLNIADLVNSGVLKNQVNFADNISQFVTFDDEQTTIDPTKAKEVLDTTIFELLPTNLTRQERIDRFFKEYNILKGEYPDFVDTDGDNIPEAYDDFNNPYDSWHDISWIQDNPNSQTIPEEESFITRLEQEENQNNVGQSLEWLRNDLDLFLKDSNTQLPEEGTASEDGRPLYENKSDGYLKFRDLNQAVIVRNPEGRDVGLEQELTVTRPDGTIFTGPTWQAKGFSIGMWVRFKDRVNSGTLFNYGNPLRENDPYGFRLDTFVLNKNDPYRDKDAEGFELENPVTWGEYLEGNETFSEKHTYFFHNDYERFVRLIVRDECGNIMDSHVGKEKRRGRVSYSREQTIRYDWACNEITPESLMINQELDYQQFAVGDHIISNHMVPGLVGDDGNANWNPNKLLLHERVPIDYDEWFYIVATYNPNIREYESFREDIYESAGPNGSSAIKYYPEFWKNNVIPKGSPPPQGYILNCQDYPLIFPDLPEGCEANYCENEVGTCNDIGTYTHTSGYGARAKIEIISRSDLLRAKGFRTS